MSDNVLRVIVNELCNHSLMCCKDLYTSEGVSPKDMTVHERTGPFMT